MAAALHKVVNRSATPRPVPAAVPMRSVPNGTKASFLLQRIEDFDGVVILASNLKSNIDDAFLRRLQSIVHFPVPKQAERKRLWTEAFPRKARLEESVNLPRIAEKYDVKGGMIMNVVQCASLMALSRGGSTVLLDDIEEAVRRELLKEGRVL